MRGAVVPFITGEIALRSPKVSVEKRMEERQIRKGAISDPAGPTNLKDTLTGTEIRTSPGPMMITAGIIVGVLMRMKGIA